MNPSATVSVSVIDPPQASWTSEKDKLNPVEDIPSEFDTNTTVRKLLEETGILGALFPQNLPRDGDELSTPLNTYDNNHYF